MRCVLGIDAGGTESVGLLADEQGRVLAESRRGGANLTLHGELAVEKVLHEILEQLPGPERIAAVCLGMAGVDRPGEHEVVRGILRRLGLRVPTRVLHDAAIVLVAGAPQRVGIAVLAGTGSIAYGVDASGRSARAGGWGPVLADEGSAFWLGQEALRRAARALDRRGPETALTALLFATLGLRHEGELVPRVYEQGLDRAAVAALAPVVQQAADGGDAVARELLEEGARALARCARAVAHRLDFGGAPFPVLLSGGCFRGCPSLVERVGRALELPGAQPRRLDAEPAAGAVALALDLLK